MSKSLTIKGDLETMETWLFVSGFYIFSAVAGYGLFNFYQMINRNHHRDQCFDLKGEVVYNSDSAGKLATRSRKLESSVFN
jgi:hypothetical protein